MFQRKKKKSGDKEPEGITGIGIVDVPLSIGLAFGLVYALSFLAPDNDVIRGK